MPQPKSTPPGKGGKPYGKKSKSFGKNMVRFNRTHSFPNLQTKFFKFMFCTSVKFQQIMQILHNSSTTSTNHVKFTPIINPFTLCLRYLPRQRTLRNSSELCRFHAIRPQHPRITQNSHHLLTHYIVCSRCLTSGRELPKIPANQAKFTQFTHISCELREFHAFHTKIHPYLVH